MNIHELLNKCNSKEVFTALLIGVVGFGSFGLGRMSVLLEPKEEVWVENANKAMVSNSLDENDLDKRFLSEETKGDLVDSNPSQIKLAQDKLIVGAKTSKKYHFPWCTGAQRISETNKVWFASIEEAKTAGYSAAGNCKGLE